MAATTLSSLESSGILPKPMAQEIIKKVNEESVVQKLAGTMPMSITGASVAVQTGQAQAGIVGEGEAKPVTNAGVAVKNIKPIKAAAIVYWSKEARLANPLGYLDFLQEQLTGAITRAFDLAVLHGKNAINGQTISGVEYVNQTTNRVELGTAAKDAGGLATDLLAGYDLVTGSDKDFDFTGFAADKAFRSKLLGAVDVQGRPIYSNPLNFKDDLGTAFGLPVAYGKAVSGKIGAAEDTKVRAFGGDFTNNLKYGFAENISFSRTDVATIVDNGQTVNLWQNNMEAFLVEAIFGWVITDKDAFVAYEDKA
ncbi:phage major capsid protein [Rothia nasimurium]|uniref:phage major capsid protein n=1 Tax=Rothia nasimurium TaxID=85336 RepID=UPI001F022FBA|nr:phage major capsid protein [Rothia nasimurium]